MADKFSDKELAELRKLPPQERLARLKQLKENRKKQEQEEARLVSESLEEIKLEEELQEIDTPDNAKPDIDDLFKEAEIDLEEEIRKTKTEVEIESVTGADYGHIMDHANEVQQRVDQMQNYLTQGAATQAREMFDEEYNRVNEELGALYATDEKIRNYNDVSDAISSLSAAKEAMQRVGQEANWIYGRRRV